MYDKEFEKQAAAARSLEFVREGTIVGLGSGSTSHHMIRALGPFLRDRGMSIRGVPTSEASRDLAREVGIPLVELNDVDHIDLTIDGADEIGPGLSLIKGGGGALFREKVVASASREMIVIGDSAKVVSTLGAFPLPVEVLPFAWKHVLRALEKLDVRPVLRYSGAVPYLTDQGNYIADCHCGVIPDPPALDRKLKSISGVIEHGMFLGLATRALVGRGPAVEEMRA